MEQILVINQVSFEFSGTELASYIKSPQFVREIDWIDIVWPKQYRFPTTNNTCPSNSCSSSVVDAKIETNAATTTTSSKLDDSNTLQTNDDVTMEITNSKEKEATTGTNADTSNNQTDETNTNTIEKVTITDTSTSGSSTSIAIDEESISPTSNNIDKNNLQTSNDTTAAAIDVTTTTKEEKEQPETGTNNNNTNEATATNNKNGPKQRIIKKSSKGNTFNSINNTYYPVIQYYCLTSGAGAYMDFHIDFGGTSVWYHIVTGMKHFILIEPTIDNLKQYENWLCDYDQSILFLPDFITNNDTIYHIILQQHETMIIPSGWIHAVYTPVDSLVYGGNFLHGFSIQMQNTITSIESRRHVLEKYRCPYYSITILFATSMYLHKLLQIQSQQQDGEEAQQEESSKVTLSDQQQSTDSIMQDDIKEEQKEQSQQQQQQQQQENSYQKYKITQREIQQIPCLLEYIERENERVLNQKEYQQLIKERNLLIDINHQHYRTNENEETAVTKKKNIKNTPTKKRSKKNSIEKDTNDTNNNNNKDKEKEVSHDNITPTFDKVAQFIMKEHNCITLKDFLTKVQNALDHIKN
jgi:hypothetical protein